MDKYMRKIKPSEHAKIVRLYGKMGCRAIAEKYGVSHQAILNILKSAGAEIRPVGTRPPK